MSQLRLLNDSTNQIVNVASVPHRSPFRYPGGKTWLAPRVRQWLLSLSGLPSEFVEPFAGGAIIGLTVAFERLADHVTIVELDAQVASVWQLTIQEGGGEWLAKRIETFDLTPKNVEAVLASDSLSVEEQAFQTIVRNRVSRGGILAKGAGLVKHGENGRGIRSRWYPATLAKRIREIDRIRDHLTFIEGDGLEIIRRNASRPDVVFFIDPPYTAGTGKRAGRRLYNCSELDHTYLFDLMQTVRGDFLMTYDNDEGVRNLATAHNFDLQPIAMKSTHHAEMTELLIGRNLNWIRE
jgi:DNA adenine methylase